MKYVPAFAIVGVILFSAVLMGNTRVPSSTQDSVKTINVIPVDNTPVLPPTPQEQLKNFKAAALTTLSLKDENVVTIFGPIGDEVTEAADKITKLSKTQSEIYVLIDSPGGSVMAGAKVVAAILASKSKVYTVCLADCLSMGFIIFEYGHERYMTPNSSLMSHPAAGGIQGTLPQIQSRLNMITRYVNRFDSYIATRAGIDLEQLHKMSESELWLDAYDAIEQKFADKLVVVDYNAPKLPVQFFLPGQERKFHLTW